MVTFKDQNPAYTYTVDSQMDDTFMAHHNNDAYLGNFFGRPIKIKEYQWSTSTTLFDEFNPWALYFQNPRVNDRIANFKNLQCKLHVKFVINGNGFHYGRLIAAYLPLESFTEFIPARSGFSADVVGLSQKPHVYLDPTTNSGGELVLPFFWMHNSLSIPDEEYNLMGRIDIATLQQLKHANGATDTVNISVFAWAEDVALSVPTNVGPGQIAPGRFDVEPHAGDEYGEGIISKPASTVARVAGKLKDVPGIGKYARATEIGAQAIGGAASALGFCKPNVVEPTLPYRPSVMGNMANTNVSDNTTKLSVDAKQELTIDPRTVGLGGDDEMSIKSIATRESFLTSFSWPTSAVGETGLWFSAVTPTLWNFVSGTFPQPELHMTACGYAAMPFNEWRGTMKFRFQVVSSNFHKGRLKIVYDPHYLLTNEYVTNYTHIVDISEEKDFTVEIGWGTNRPFLGTWFPGIEGSVTDPPFGVTIGDVPLKPDKSNGVLGVYVVNNLTVPSDVDNDIEVNVFVSMGDDVQYRNPSDCLAKYFWFSEPNAAVAQVEPHAGDEMAMVDGENTTEPNKPMDQESDESMGNALKLDDAYDHVFFGETIVSMRDLVKRFCYHHPCIRSATEAKRCNFVLQMSSFPFHRGYVPGGIDDVAKGKYNYGMMTFINFLVPAFAGWRGGIRWKSNMSLLSNPAPVVGDIQVARLPGTTVPYSAGEIAMGISSDKLDKSMMIQANQTTLAGGTASNYAVCPTMEWEIPYSNPTRFLPGGRANYTTNQLKGQYAPTGMAYQMAYARFADSTVQIKLYCAGGEDFTTFFFIGAPPMFYNVSIPFA
jgi:hypothetical protein